MKITKRIFLLMCCFSLGISGSVKGAEQITKENTFVSETKNDKGSGFDEKIQKDGKTYILKDIKYETVKSEPVKEIESVEELVKSKPVKKEVAYTPENEFTKNGLVYKLVKTDKKDVVIEKAYKQAVKGYTDYTNPNDAENAPDTKIVSAVNKKTGEKVSTECRKTTVEVLPEESWIDTYIDITFLSYDLDEFVWHGVTVSKNTKAPLKGYEKELIESVGADTKDYKILKTYWKGKSYKNSDGVICRNARADVLRKTNYSRVNYEGSINVPEVLGYEYTSVYKTEILKDTGKTKYTIKATAFYEAKSNPVLQITLGILVFMVLVVGVLFILKKKQKEK